LTLGRALGGAQEIREIRGLGQAHGGMVPALFAQPVIIADHPVPGIAHQGDGEESGNLVHAHQHLDIGQRRVLPQPPARAQALQPPRPRPRLGGVADQDVILHRPRLQREAKRRAPGLGNMDEDVAAPARNDHAAQSAPLHAARKGGGRRMDGRRAHRCSKLPSRNDAPSVDHSPQAETDSVRYMARVGFPFALRAVLLDQVQ